MDEMQEWELHLISNMIPWAGKNSYEQTRLIMWSIAAPYFKKGQGKSPEQFFPLYTDENKAIKYDEKTQNAITREVTNMNLFGDKKGE